MKKLTLALAAFVVAGAFASCATPKPCAPLADMSEYPSENTLWSGMYFSAEYITEEYEYDDAYCIRYDNPDSNMFDVEIVVDLETYLRCIDSVRSGDEMIGTLVIDSEESRDGRTVWTFMEEPEYEMAAASAGK